MPPLPPPLSVYKYCFVIRMATSTRDENPALVETYRQSLRFFQENEGRRRLQCRYEDQVRLVAYTQQVSLGPFHPDKAQSVGAFDVIGKDRRNAWKNLGSMSREDAMKLFVESIKVIFPEFTPELKSSPQTIIKTSENNNASITANSNNVFDEEKALIEAQQCKEKQRQEDHRRQIQDALNKQTFNDFKAYAQEQYPNNPDQQAVFIKQLQAQHYLQYMKQIYQQQMEAGNKKINSSESPTPSAVVDSLDEKAFETLKINDEACNTERSEDERGAVSRRGNVIEDDHSAAEDEDYDNHECSEECGFCRDDEISPADMWTKKEIVLFKESIRQEGGDSIIKVGQGETATVRVPTHDDGGSALFWEFATDNYDIAFGLFFEWTKSEDETRVSVHISDSEDEDIGDDDTFNENGDPERASSTALLEKGPSTTEIVPIYRRDCHEEVYAGTHNYPGPGVYLLKFDNTYSLWRSKTLYYRVYYTR